MKIIIIALMGGALSAQEPAKLSADQVKDITINALNKEVNDRDKEIAALKAELATIKGKLIATDQYNLLKVACESHQIPLEDCRIDIKSSMVTRVQTSTAKPPTSTPNKEKGEK